MCGLLSAPALAAFAHTYAQTMVAAIQSRSYAQGLFSMLDMRDRCVRSRNLCKPAAPGPDACYCQQMVSTAVCMGALAGVGTWLTEARADRLLDEQHREALVP